ncbi:MAG: tyrosine-type recombinase/integrase [Acidimicrobiales bacterium]
MAENVGRRGSSWFYRVDLPAGVDGRRRQKRVGGFRTEREARRAHAAAVVDVSRGTLRYSPARTFAELAAEWLEAVAPNRKASTAANYALLVNAYLVPRLGSRRLDRLSASDIQHLYAELRSSGGRGGRSLSGTQVRNIHRVLHNVLGYACRIGYLTVNPADSVEKPKDDTAERRVYTPEQVQQFLAAAKDDRLRALWHLVISTGLRRSELAGLQWRDVDLAATPSTLTVRSARTRAGSRVVDSDPKTRASRRTLVLDRSSIALLASHRDEMAAEAAHRGETATPAYVFVDELGQAYRPEWLTRHLHVIQVRAGLPEITLHDLRHTSATVALLAGVHPKVVTERHGHASTQITLDRYSHVLESMKVSAADAIDRFLQPAG